LDIVPDNTVTLEDYFSRKEMAWNALAKVYSYLPSDPETHSTSWSLGDEWMGRVDMNNNAGNVVAMRIMRGLQNTTSPILGHWNGTSGGRPLYQGIRSANIFLEYIDMVQDMTESEIKEWKAQVKFLKAYYHFLLLRQYGPIVIADKPVPLDALSDDLFQKRSKVEDCFNFIIDLMNEAIPDLNERAGTNDLGQVDKVAAMAIKARVMLFRASPFLNGNSEYYGDFLDFDGQPFFPIQYNHEKWKDVIDAVNEAIALCETNGLGLYEYEKNPYIYDREDYLANTTLMKTLYDLRMVIADPWNKELVWGQTTNYGSGSILAGTTNMRLPTGYEGIINNPGFSEQWMCASYRMLERYYTKNGIPLDEDLTVDKNILHRIVTTPGIETPEYVSMRGLLQPGAETVILYLDREPRFYANLGITGGYWRSHGVRIATMMFGGSDGGYMPSYSTTQFFCTGIGVQKFVNPESKSGAWDRVIRFPYPIMRMADLYLMKAEALNEYNDTPTAEVYETVNKVRRRAGIPDVEDAWSNVDVVRPEYLDKHLTKEGMREIILRERSIELAFEGSRFWDMHRYKKAVPEFSSPIMGWSYEKSDAKSFFVLESYQTRRFINRDYLWPVTLDEINKNANLIQNPGWDGN
jgi:hypothetical protein